jgi:hypothetical protein
MRNSKTPSMGLLWRIVDDSANYSSGANPGPVPEPLGMSFAGLMAFRVVWIRAALTWLDSFKQRDAWREQAAAILRSWTFPPRNASTSERYASKWFAIPRSKQATLIHLAGLEIDYDHVPPRDSMHQVQRALRHMLPVTALQTLVFAYSDDLAVLDLVQLAGLYSLVQDPTPYALVFTLDEQRQMLRVTQMLALYAEPNLAVRHGASDFLPLAQSWRTLLQIAVERGLRVELCV